MKPDIFISTTYFGKRESDLKNALNELEVLPVDGIEIGSTHKYSPDNSKTIKSISGKRLLFHNYFPPSKEPLILNIASSNDNLRKKSVDYIKKCISFCESHGGELYTFHPGFLNDAVSEGISENNYDFVFQKSNLNYDEAYNLMIESIDDILSFSNGLGLKIAIETQGSTTKSADLLMQRPEEFQKLFSIFPSGLEINLNLAHSYFASKMFNFSLKEFIVNNDCYIDAVELNHSNSLDDEHLPLEKGSYIFNYLSLIANKKLVLEFRNANADDIKQSIGIVRSYFAAV